MIHELGFSWRQSGSNDPLSATVPASADGEQNYDVALAANAADVTVAAVIDVSEIKAFFILSDKDAKIETNNSGSPVNTVNLTAGVPCSWVLGCGLANPFATDVTALYVTNLNATDAATVKIRFLKDATP